MATTQLSTRRICCGATRSAEATAAPEERRARTTRRRSRLLLFASVLHSLVSSPSVSATFPPPAWSSATLVFREEFASANLSANGWSVWDNRTHGDKEHVCYRSSQVRVQDGLLRLLAAREPHPVRCGSDPVARNYSSGWLETNAFKNVPNASCSYLIAANVSLPARKYIGLWPAAWTWAQSGCWPGGGEIDMVEGNANPLFPAATASYHWAKDDANCLKKKTKHDDTDMEKKGFGALYAPLRSELPGFWTAFHVFSAIWTQDTLSFFLDDDTEPTYEKKGSAGVFIANSSQKLVLDLDVQPVDENWLDNYDDGAAFLVDFFRVYQACV